MKKFAFPLENALKVRELKKRLAEKDIMVTNARLDKNRKEQKACNEAYVDSFSYLSRGDGEQAFWLEVVSGRQRALKSRIKDLSDQEAVLEKRRKDEMDVLMERMKDVKVMEKLKAYQKEAHASEAAKEEQETMEELDILKRGGSQ